MRPFLNQVQAHQKAQWDVTFLSGSILAILAR